VNGIVHIRSTNKLDHHHLIHHGHHAIDFMIMS